MSEAIQVLVLSIIGLPLPPEQLVTLALLVTLLFLLLVLVRALLLALRVALASLARGEVAAA